MSVYRVYRHWSVRAEPKDPQSRNHITMLPHKTLLGLSLMTIKPYSPEVQVLTGLRDWK